MNKFVIPSLRPTSGSYRRSIIAWTLMLIVGIGTTACSLNNLLDAGVTGQQPNNSAVDPNVVDSYTGALGLYYGAIIAIKNAVSVGSRDVAVFTDEIYAQGSGNYASLDGRIAALGPPNGITAGGYVEFQTARVQAAQAAAALLKYGTQASYPLIGEAYALQAHAITMLAEEYCSGVPLTEAPLGGNLKYTAALSTTQLLEHAVALFDTAYQYGKDSLPIATFAKVGKGRALLNLGRYADAKAAVVGVETSSEYHLEFIVDRSGSGSFWTDPSLTEFVTMSPEGTNGMRWQAATPAVQDPRVPFDVTDPGTFRTPLVQKKYPSTTANVPIADGIQARLIEAEADLQPADAPSEQWLSPLNAARRTLGIPDTTDPGTKDGRINLLFHERAFWFYLNGQRLGDLRRLIRQYGRRQDRVFPVGAYPNPTASVPAYGAEIVFVPPVSEQDYNPLYKGCLSKGA